MQCGELRRQTVGQGRSIGTLGVKLSSSRETACAEEVLSNYAQKRVMRFRRGEEWSVLRRKRLGEFLGAY